jgi:hypothetical protein
MKLEEFFEKMKKVTILIETAELRLVGFIFA